MTTVEVLEKARALVARPGGWQQGGYGTPEKCCAAHALRLASDRTGDINWSDFAPYQILEAALGLEPQSLKVSRWNDAPERTQAEVVAAFDKAIELARSAP